MPTVELEIPPRSAYVRVVRLAFTMLARQAQFDEDRVDDLKIAISEACTNAVLSNESAGKRDPVTITWTDEADRVVIGIEDRGTIYTGGQDPLDSQGLGQRIMMSVALLESLVDECEIIPRADGSCAELVMIRQRNDST
jgi:serine/threonine-protein kinase RsbW